MDKCKEGDRERLHCIRILLVIYILDVKSKKKDFYALWFGEMIHTAQ